MTVAPLKRYRIPHFPTYDFLLEHPILLEKLPDRWCNNKLVMLALGTLSFMMGSCKPDEPKWEGGIVVPILTENEAQQIIREEASTAGITFITDSLTIPNVRIPISFIRYSHPSDSVHLTPETNLTLDGHDTLRQISYEFISETDLSQWRIQSDTLYEIYNINRSKTARELQTELRTQRPDLHVGVFSEQNGNPQDLRQQVRDFISWLHQQGVY